MFKETDFLDENFYKIIDFVSANIYWKDKEGRYLGCNQYALNKYGLKSFKEAIGKNDYEVLLISENEISQIIENDKYALKHGIFEGEECVTFNGERITYLSKKIAFLNEKGEVAGIMGTSLDITNQKKLIELERKKIILEEQLKTTQIIDSVNASIYWKDQKEEKYLGCNQYMLDMLGLSDRSQVIGKTDADLMWKADSVNLTKVDNNLISHGTYVGEEKVTIANGSQITFLTVKNQLMDSDGNVVGVIGTSLDITSQKEAEQLRFESQAQKIALEEKEKFTQLARKVAHDINSPLAALKMMIPLCTEIPENKRSLLNRAAEGILDIANNLLNTHHKEKNSSPSDVEARQPLLVSDLLIQLLSEKKVQYCNRPVTFDTVIASDAQFAFIEMQTTEFRRSISNLINNAVDAFESNASGKVMIQLKADVEAVVVEIKDNGKGMTSNMMEKMQNRESFTEGKENGHGLGLQQVWDTLEYNQGSMDVQSTLGEGTSIKLTFPRIAASKWIAQDIHLNPDNIVVILDDDESIHTAWNLQFTPVLASDPVMQLHHFTQGQEALNFLAALSQEEKSRVVFLSDYELLYQDKNGLEIVEASGIKRAILVTSYYSNPKIRKEADRLGIKVLPKQMASIIPIHIDTAQN